MEDSTRTNTNQEETVHSEEVTKDVVEETGIKEVGREEMKIQNAGINEARAKETGIKETEAFINPMKKTTIQIPQNKERQTSHHKTSRKLVESDGTPTLDVHTSSTASAKHVWES